MKYSMSRLECERPPTNRKKINRKKSKSGNHGHKNETYYITERGSLWNTKNDVIVKGIRTIDAYIIIVIDLQDRIETIVEPFL